MVTAASQLFHLRGRFHQCIAFGAYVTGRLLPRSAAEDLPSDRFGANYSYLPRAALWTAATPKIGTSGGALAAGPLSSFVLTSIRQVHGLHGRPLLYPGAEDRLLDGGAATTFHIRECSPPFAAASDSAGEPLRRGGAEVRESCSVVAYLCLPAAACDRAARAVLHAAPVEWQEGDDLAGRQAVRRRAGTGPRRSGGNAAAR
jgi:hypothetical protein